MKAVPLLIFTLLSSQEALFLLFITHRHCISHTQALQNFIFPHRTHATPRHIPMDSTPLLSTSSSAHPTIIPSLKNSDNVVLVVGGGGREASLAWKLSLSPLVSKVYISPGNAGCEEESSSNADPAHIYRATIPLSPASSYSQLLEFCKEKGVDLVVVGPEQHLSDGIADVLRKHQILCFGPNKEASMLESSKAVAKQFMSEFLVPTADFRVFKGKQQMEEALVYVHHMFEELKRPVVIKASGLAAGKGVVVPETLQEAREAVIDCMDRGVFGTAGEEVVIEERIAGREASVFVISDGKDYRVLPPCVDYKRVCDGDLGLNTGGVGSICPAPFVTEMMMKKIEKDIVKPTISGISKRNMDFVGCIYIGLMIDEEDSAPSSNSNGFSAKIKVLEYNVRFGDPETESLLSLLNSDFFELLRACCLGQLSELPPVFFEHGKHAVTVIMTSFGYPKEFEKGYAIEGLENVKDVHVFHCGTKRDGAGKVVTNGGRVLAITAVGDSLEEARKKAYSEGVNLISWKDCHYRKDIALF